MKKLLFITGLLLLSSCAIKPSITNQYKLTAFSDKRASHTSSHSILVTAPEAVSGYDTEQMLYVKKPFEVGVFAHNAWIAPPADMLFPLILESLQRTGYYRVVASSPYSDRTEYRLDTQLLELHQNFLTKPSEISLKVKVVLSNVNNSRVINSTVIAINVPCPAETPYGGVLAANIATKQLTAAIDEFAARSAR